MNRQFLELGAGSGLISVWAAKHGAKVTATDINPVSIECIHYNANANKVQLRVIESDLFAQVPIQQFDIIAINPPYYKKQPASHADHAWYCGEHGEYFESLFKDLEKYMHAGTTALMILCDGADIEMVQEFASAAGLRMNCIFTKQNLIEKNFIYQIVPVT